jgi:hypothetical protein
MADEQQKQVEQEKKPQTEQGLGEKRGEADKKAESKERRPELDAPPSPAKKKKLSWEDLKMKPIGMIEMFECPDETTLLLLPRGAFTEQQLQKLSSGSPATKFMGTDIEASPYPPIYERMEDEVTDLLDSYVAAAKKKNPVTQNEITFVPELHRFNHVIRLMRGDRRPIEYYLIPHEM